MHNMQNEREAKRPPFDTKELEVLRMKKSGAAAMFTAIVMPDIRPITSKENIRLALAGEKPYWMPQVGWMFCDVNVFRPRLLADNTACRIVCDIQPDRIC